MLKLIRKGCCSWWMTSVMSAGIDIVSRIPYPHHLSLRYTQWSQDLGSTSLKEESESESHPVVSDSLRPQGLYSSGNSPGQNTGVGSLSLLQGIFPTQGSNPGVSHCRQILYQLSRREAQEYWSGWDSIEEDSSQKISLKNLNSRFNLEPTGSIEQNDLLWFLTFFLKGLSTLA